MKKITGSWIGSIQGTNNGTLFAEFSESDGYISGEVHINDPVNGTAVYTVSEASSSSDTIRLVLKPHKNIMNFGHGIVTVLAHLDTQTQCTGEWRSTIGTAGTLSLTRVKTTNTIFTDKGITSNRKMNAIVMTSDQANTLNPTRTKIFISYSHEDSDWLNRLKIHLKPLERDYAIDVWEDTKIQPGSKWFEEIERAIKLAKIALLIP
ncbi:MAG: toll/interleukin-1 receptor domain-containing protein [Bacteroidetes bacterium]|nr:toll/interleukin-1 receptor domain-containing protein [Bacteroidota bacterium]